MSIARSGSFGKRFGEVSAISKQLSSVSLKPVRRMTVTFDPFYESPNIRYTRDFLYYISSLKIAATNPSCRIKTDVVCDRREPTVHFKLLPDFAEKLGSEDLIFKTANLTCLEILTLMNKYLTPLVPKEKVVEEVQTKLTKKSKKR